MTAMDSTALRIGAWRVDPALDEIFKDGNTVKLERRAMQLLLCLAENAGKPVSVEQLLDQVWKGVVVTPDSVYQVVAALRRILGDDAKDPTYIANIPRRGYRLVAPVGPWADAPDEPPAPSRGQAVEPARVAHSVAPTPWPRPRSPRLLIAVAALALGFVVYGSWLFHRDESQHRTAAASTPVVDRSIAILPFIDMSEKKDQEYFADGMAEEILDLLATIPALKVIGRTSSFQFKNKNEDLRAIGIKLGAVYVVEGSVRKSENRVRVAAQLIDSQDGTLRWSGTYDRAAGDVLKLEGEVAAGIVRALQVTIGADAMQSRPTVANSEAYNLYLRGRYALNRYNKDGFDEATRWFQQALELDPTSATMAWLSWTYEVQGEWGFLAPTVAFEQARRAAETALQRNSKLALPHVVLAGIHTSYDYNWAAADEELHQALALAPHDATATFLAARLSMDVGRWDEALTQLNGVLAQDPLSAAYYQVLDWIQARRRRMPEAEMAARRVLEISPTYDSAHYYLGIILLERAEREAALAEMEKETQTGGQLAGLTMVYDALGRKSESDAAIARMTKEQGKRNAFEIAEAYAMRGNRDLAFQWLERAYAQKESDLQYIKGDLPLKNLVDDPRYKAFLRKMNLPE